MMNAYLFSAWVTRVKSRRTRSVRGDYDTIGSEDGCTTLIICADTPEEGERKFKQWLAPPSDSEQSESVAIRKVFAAPVMEYLFTESGTPPLDWKKTIDEITAQLESTAVDDFEQGYWLDVNEAVRAGLSVEELRESLPEDVRSGLNWSAEKQFLFLLTVLSPPAPLVEPSYDSDAENPGHDGNSESNASEPSQSDLLEQQAAYPQLAEKEVAAIIRARNSAVAASLWRNYAVTTRLNANSIRIDPPCGIALPDEIGAKKE